MTVDNNKQMDTHMDASLVLKYSLYFQSNVDEVWAHIRVRWYVLLRTYQ